MLVGEGTIRLVRDAVEAEPIDPMPAKGKAEPVPAYRLLRARSGRSSQQARAAPMIGRERQQKLLEDAFANVVGERACQLFTVLGAAGVGKSRLVAEFLRQLEGARPSRAAAACRTARGSATGRSRRS